jgi:hypothetical protein
MRELSEKTQSESKLMLDWLLDLFKSFVTRLDVLLATVLTFVLHLFRKLPTFRRTRPLAILRMSRSESPFIRFTVSVLGEFSARASLRLNVFTLVIVETTAGVASRRTNGWINRP